MVQQHKEAVEQILQKEMADLRDEKQQAASQAADSLQVILNFRSFYNL